MYCMPQPGTRVSLYFPNYDEKRAIAVNCIRTNGGGCDRMSDPSKRSFVTEHGKEMNLYPGEMSLIGGGNGLITLSDEDGITIGSGKPVVIVAKGEIKFEAAQAVVQALVGEIVTAKGDPVTGDVDSSFVMCNNYDAVSQIITQAAGWNLIEYEPYDDEPEEAGFDLRKLALNVAAGLVVVAAVAVTLATFGAAGPVIIGAIAVGAMAVVSKGVSDCMSGSISGIESYMLAGFLGAVAGAVSGGVGLIVEGAIPEGAALLTQMGISGVGGVLETVIENGIQGQKTTLFDLGLAFVLSAGFYGLGDNIARMLMKWKGVAAQADDAARVISKQTNNVTAQADDAARAIARQTDNVAHQADTVTSVKGVANRPDHGITGGPKGKDIPAGQNAGDVPAPSSPEKHPSLRTEGKRIIYTNPSGNEISWVNQTPKDMDAIIRSRLNSSLEGNILEGQVAQAVKEMGLLKGVALELNGPRALKVGDIDVLTDSCIIEVKKSLGSVDLDQLKKLTQADNENFFNYDGKKIIYYIKDMNVKNHYNAEKLAKLKEANVTIISTLDDLKGVLFE